MDRLMDRPIENFRPQGPARIIWRYGIVFSAMFLVYAFANIGLAILDSDYSGIGAPLIYGAYAVVHLVVNNAFKATHRWGSQGLIVIYALWMAIAVIKFFTIDGPLTLLTALLIAVGSGLMVALLIRVRGVGAIETGRRT